MQKKKKKKKKICLNPLNYTKYHYMNEKVPCLFLCIVSITLSQLGRNEKYGK